MLGTLHFSAPPKENSSRVTVRWLVSVNVRETTPHRIAFADVDSDPGLAVVRRSSGSLNVDVVRVPAGQVVHFDAPNAGLAVALRRTEGVRVIQGELNDEVVE